MGKLSLTGTCDDLATAPEGYLCHIYDESAEKISTDEFNIDETVSAPDIRHDVSSNVSVRFCFSPTHGAESLMVGKEYVERLKDNDLLYFSFNMDRRNIADLDLVRGVFSENVERVLLPNPWPERRWRNALLTWFLSDIALPPQEVGIVSGLRSEILMLEGSLQAFQDELESIGSKVRLHSLPLNSLDSERWKLREPLWVTIEERGEDDFIACLYEADVFGYGDSVPDALDELRSAIVNQFIALQEAEQECPLVPKLSRQLEFLRERIDVSSDL